MIPIEALRLLERVVAEWATPPLWCPCNMFRAEGTCYHTGYKPRAVRR